MGDAMRVASKKLKTQLKLDSGNPKSAQETGADGESAPFASERKSAQRENSIALGSATYLLLLSDEEVATKPLHLFFQFTSKPSHFQVSFFLIDPLLQHHLSYNCCCIRKNEVHSSTAVGQQQQHVVFSAALETIRSS